MTGTAPTIQAPNHSPALPGFTVPKNACDSHCHVFGPHIQFPYEVERPYTPHDVSEAQLRALHEKLRLRRAVIVQAAPHGGNHAALLAALAAGNGRYRGVALPGVLRGDLPVVELAARGICGVRFNFVSRLGPHPPWAQVQEAAETIRPLGWHIALHLFPPELLALEAQIAELRAVVVIDHMARIDPAEGPDGAACAALRRLLSLGHVWVKLSAADRNSHLRWPHKDSIELAAELATCFPHRVVWGTDFPHPNVTTMPDDGKMLNLVPHIAPGEAALRQLLVENPRALFGFAD